MQKPPSPGNSIFVTLLTRGIFDKTTKNRSPAGFRVRNAGPLEAACPGRTRVSRPLCHAARLRPACGRDIRVPRTPGFLLVDSRLCGNDEGGWDARVPMFTTGTRFRFRRVGQMPAWERRIARSREADPSARCDVARRRTVSASRIARSREAVPSARCDVARRRTASASRIARSREADPKTRCDSGAAHIARPARLRPAAPERRPGAWQGSIG